MLGIPIIVFAEGTVTVVLVPEGVATVPAGVVVLAGVEGPFRSATSEEKKLPIPDFFFAGAAEEFEEEVPVLLPDAVSEELEEEELEAPLALEEVPSAAFFTLPMKFAFFWNIPYFLSMYDNAPMWRFNSYCFAFVVGITAILRA